VESVDEVSKLQPATTAPLAPREEHAEPATMYTPTPAAASGAVHTPPVHAAPAGRMQPKTHGEVQTWSRLGEEPPLMAPPAHTPPPGHGVHVPVALLK
jgi:hypothetical protein